MAIGWVVGTLHASCGAAENRCCSRPATEKTCCSVNSIEASGLAMSPRAAEPDRYSVCACEHALRRMTPLPSLVFVRLGAAGLVVGVEERSFAHCAVRTIRTRAIRNLPPGRGPPPYISSF